jgi:hypothetical protein
MYWSLRNFGETRALLITLAKQVLSQLSYRPEGLAR